MEKKIKDRINAMGEADLDRAMEKFLGMKDSEKTYECSLYETAKGFADWKITGDLRRRMFSSYVDESLYSTRGSYREGFIKELESVLF